MSTVEERVNEVNHLGNRVKKANEVWIAKRINLIHDLKDEGIPQATIARLLKIEPANVSKYLKRPRKDIKELTND